MNFNAFLFRQVIIISRKMAHNLKNACLEEPESRVTRSATKRKFVTYADKTDKNKQKATWGNDESSKLMENPLQEDPTIKSLKIHTADKSDLHKQNHEKQEKTAVAPRKNRTSKIVSVKSDTSEETKSTPRSQRHKTEKKPKIECESPSLNSNRMLTETTTTEEKPKTVRKLTNPKGSKASDSEKKSRNSQPSNHVKASEAVKSDEEHCEHFQESDDKLPGIKKMKIPKSQNSSSATNKSKGDGSTKPELVIPEIIIPVDKKIILRKDGPSPWNGTIKYDNKVFLGAHISAAGGLENAISNAVKIGGSSFALFLKNQRQWVSKPMEESTVERFKAACAEQDFPPHLILPHGSYLMNCGSSDPAILSKSRATLLDEVQRCERLGILYYNIHPGSTCGKGSREEAMQNIADSINWVHDQTPGSKVAVVLENMCRQGHTIGGDFAELAKIIQLVFDQSRVGVCLDTCHALAAGYDLASSEGFEAFLVEFERIIGFRYLVAVHLNDSEGALGCHRDRHASIGKGHIGLEGFRRIINCPRFRDIPLVLETPYISEDFYKKEILLLKSLAQTGTVCA